MTGETSNSNIGVLGSLLAFNAEAVGGLEGIEACLQKSRSIADSFRVGVLPTTIIVNHR